MNLRFLLLLCLFSSLLTAETFPLWPKGAPEALGSEETDIPTLTVTFPEQGTGNGAAVVICPGGGYRVLSMDNEGHDVAKWFNQQGYTAAVLKYRLPVNGYRHPVPLQDVQYALQTLRARSDAWQLNPEMIGVFGSSAGGHLAATAATHFLAGDPDAADPILKVSSRPDFLVMLYPVISLDASITHYGSKNSLLGMDPSSELVESLSNELQVTAETPPTFIVLADNDTTVKAENSVRFYLALRKEQVPAEMHIFKEGGHGFGMRKQSGLPVIQWPNLLNDWLQAEVHP
jgi:acetyl esterase/lipase